MGRVNPSLFLFSLSFFSFASAVPLFDGEFSLGYLSQSPDGWISYKGDRVDVKDDLKLGDENSYFIKMKVKHSVPLLPDVYLMYTKMNFSGDGTVKKSFKFGNVTVNVNNRVKTDLKLDHYDVGFFYNIPFLDKATLGILKAEAGLYFRIIDFKARVENKTQRRVDKTSSIVPLPLLYLSSSLNPFEWISLNIEAKGITYSGDYYYDIQGEIRYYPLSSGIARPFLSFGYRYEKIKFDDIDDTSADIDISQPFISAGVVF